MDTPVVTLKITPRELKTLDIALEALAATALCAHEAKLGQPNHQEFCESVVRLIWGAAPEEDPRRLVLMANKLRETISLF